MGPAERRQAAARSGVAGCEHPCQEVDIVHRCLCTLCVLQSPDTNAPQTNANMQPQPHARPTSSGAARLWGGFVHVKQRRKGKIYGVCRRRTRLGTPAIFARVL